MRMRGAALPLVLWLVMLMAALIGSFAMTARIEAMQGHAFSRSAAAQETARAGVEYAMLRMSDPDPGTRWIPDGRSYRWRFDGSELEIRIVDESGKVDLNQADAGVLSGLLQGVGIETDQAQRLAAAVIDWRDADDLTQAVGGAEDRDYAASGLPYGAKDAPFESVAELRQVLGVSPEIYARIAPYLTIHAGMQRPNPQFAPAAVLTALGLDPAQVLKQRESLAASSAGFTSAGTGTYSIASLVRRPDGHTAALHAVLRMGASPVPGSVYTVIQWDEDLAGR